MAECGKISGKEADGLSTHSSLIQSLTGDNGELVLQFFVELTLNCLTVAGGKHIWKCP
jgi:hypothetical protein